MIDFQVHKQLFYQDDSISKRVNIRIYFYAKLSVLQHVFGLARDQQTFQSLERLDFESWLHWMYALQFTLSDRSPVDFNLKLSCILRR